MAKGIQFIKAGDELVNKNDVVSVCAANDGKDTVIHLAAGELSYLLIENTKPEQIVAQFNGALKEVGGTFYNPDNIIRVEAIKNGSGTMIHTRSHRYDYKSIPLNIPFDEVVESLGLLQPGFAASVKKDARGMGA